MAQVTNLSTGYSISLEGVLFDQINSCNINTGSDIFNEAADSIPDPSFSALAYTEPVFEIETSAIKSLLDTIGIDGLVISTGCVVYAYQFEEGGTRKSGANHTSFTLSEGMYVLGSINADQRSCTATFTVHGTSTNGTTNPVAIATSQSVIAGSPTVTEMFVAGPCSANGTEINGIQSLTIDFGVQVVKVGGSGSAYPTFIALQSRRPSVTITAYDTAFASTIGFDGVAVSVSDVLLNLKKVQEGAARVANATTEHILFTIDAGRVEIESLPTSGDSSPSLLTVKITPSWDGSNNIVVFDTTSAITV